MSSTFSQTLAEKMKNKNHEVLLKQPVLTQNPSFTYIYQRKLKSAWKEKYFG